MDTWQAWITVAGLGLITLITRALFVIPRRAVPLPGWLQKGLRHAPLAALVAIVAPGVVMRDGQLVATLMDARVLAALAAGAWYFWRRGILGTIVVGLTVMLALRLGWGW